MKGLSFLLMFIGVLTASGCAQNGKTAHLQPPDWTEGRGSAASEEQCPPALGDLDNGGNRDIIGKANFPGTPSLQSSDSRGRLSDPSFADVSAKGQAICTVDFNENGLSDVTLAPREELDVREEVTENSVFKTIAGIPQYKVGPGDVLEVSIWKGMEASKHEIVVKADGQTSFGCIDSLDVRGMTTGELEDLLVEELKEYVRSPKIDVVVKKFNSKSFSLFGAVATIGRHNRGPGRYPLKGRATILELLGEAGGPSERANLREVTLRRKDGGTLTLDLHRAIIHGDESQDVVIDDGDMVFVPTMQD